MAHSTKAGPSPVAVIVEDHPELRHVLRTAFENEGYEVVPVSDEAAACEVVRTREVHLLVSDRSGTGAAAVDGLTELEQEFPALPTIVLSEDPGRSRLFFGPWERAGLRRTLRKPFKLADLLALAREARGDAVASAGNR